MYSINSLEVTNFFTELLLVRISESNARLCSKLRLVSNQRLHPVTHLSCLCQDGSLAWAEKTQPLKDTAKLIGYVATSPLKTSPQHSIPMNWLQIRQNGTTHHLQSSSELLLIDLIGQLLDEAASTGIMRVLIANESDVGLHLYALPGIFVFSFFVHAQGNNKKINIYSMPVLCRLWCSADKESLPCVSESQTYSEHIHQQLPGLYIVAATCTCTCHIPRGALYMLYNSGFKRLELRRAMLPLNSMPLYRS
jgi:hypothetical protein